MEEKENKDSKKSSNKKLFIIIGIIAAILVVGGIVYAVFIKDNCTGGINNPEMFLNYPPGVKKPIIYLYPEKEMEINVVVGRPENLTHTYPKYNGSWDVIAKPDGNLIDIKTGRNLYSLYWEGLNTVTPNMKEGFVVEGKDTIAFLEEKLEILGLNEREANEFIIYWLPILENNKYNFIRFQTIEEINNNMPLQVIPNPDSIIRVVMEFKGLEKYVKVPEQELLTPVRNGFVLVEWGGTEIY